MSRDFYENGWVPQANPGNLIIARWVGSDEDEGDDVAPKGDKHGAAMIKDKFFLLELGESVQKPLVSTARRLLLIDYFRFLALLIRKCQLALCIVLFHFRTGDATLEELAKTVLAISLACVICLVEVIGIQQSSHRYKMD